MDRIDPNTDYMIIDCPGQIELYSHLGEFEIFFDHLKQFGFNIGVLYLLDSQFMLEKSRYVGGVLWALSSMVMFECPHINILTKVDILDETLRSKLDDLIENGTGNELDVSSFPSRYNHLNNELSKLVDEYSMVTFYTLNYDEDESLEDLLVILDNATQFGEDEEVKAMVKIHKLRGYRCIVSYEKNLTLLSIHDKSISPGLGL
ncbi:GPN-loop GTPase 3 [Thelohanellus kitauei]|uniref:GPN-loop GTPase 3 n=1 Tax=Thelohanellus kitauei TaxID=669202 RepID=A0A0C2IR44_THEKT|nr:GPN-loop GTPase 3 [Thelohanellus kitauei]